MSGPDGSSTKYEAYVLFFYLFLSRIIIDYLIIIEAHLSDAILPGKGGEVDASTYFRISCRSYSGRSSP